MTDRTRTLVVVGQGYVGLPLAHAAGSGGFRVYGFESNEEVAQSLNAGRSHVDDIADADISRMLSHGYRATTDASVISQADVVVICVPTPLADDSSPDMSAVISATETTAKHLQPGTLVVLESTTYPGTTEELVLPILETSGLTHGADFHLAFSPERVDPGNLQYGIINTPKLVGGVTPAATDVAAAFYGQFVDTVVPLSGSREAET
ncbi:nucleotide sugar dehydrogenase, partial [Georgenia sp. MJ206]|uniref:nucleotide sugar dehydrogenase n=1 Tax=Georgenia wangjunii TaxID=3117730 RepID=UPI002F25F518